MNKISVILTLNKTTCGLDSILNQSYQNIEIIALYNNLSQEQIDNYKKIEKLKLIKINDSNKWNNRIIGFDNSTGDYIYFWAYMVKSSSEEYNRSFQIDITTSNE